MLCCIPIHEICDKKLLYSLITCTHDLTYSSCMGIQHALKQWDDYIIFMNAASRSYIHSCCSWIFMQTISWLQFLFLIHRCNINDLTMFYIFIDRCIPRNTSANTSCISEINQTSWHYTSHIVTGPRTLTNAKKWHYWICWLIKQLSVRRLDKPYDYRARQLSKIQSSWYHEIHKVILPRTLMTATWWQKCVPCQLVSIDVQMSFRCHATVVIYEIPTAACHRGLIDLL